MANTRSAISTSKLTGSVDVVWWAACRKALWSELTKAGRSIKTQEGYKTVAIGPILTGSAKTAQAITLYCTIKLEDDIRKILCHLELKPKPIGRTPKWVSDHSEAIGGIDGLHQWVRKFVPEVPPIADYEIEIELPIKEGWNCRLLHMDESADSELVRRLGKKSNREYIGYRFENGILGMEEMSIFFDHIEKKYSLNLEAGGPLQLQEDMSLPFVDQIRDYVVSTCFVKQRTKK